MRPDRPLLPWRPRALEGERLWRTDPPASWLIADAAEACRDVEERDRLARAYADQMIIDVDGTADWNATMGHLVGIWMRANIGALIRWMVAADDVRAAHLVPEDIQ